MAAIDSLFIRANMIEAVLWGVIALVVAVLTVRRADLRPHGFILTITLILFGISDLVETRKGGWYKPWWMLCWKAGCVAVLLGTLRHLHRTHRK